MDYAKLDDYDFLLKLLVVGDMGVGKTCLVQRYTDDMFCDSHISTIGVDFRIKTISMDQKKVKLQLWDTAGQERFKSITQSYYRGAHGIILVYDASDMSTFRNLETWLEEIDAVAPQSCQKLVVANKKDIQTKRGGGVDPDLARAWAEQRDMQFIETSAQDNVNVHAAFQAMASQCMNISGLATSNKLPIKQNPNSKIISPRGGHGPKSWFSMCTIL